MPLTAEPAMPPVAMPPAVVPAAATFFLVDLTGDCSSFSSTLTFSTSTPTNLASIDLLPDGVLISLNFKVRWRSSASSILPFTSLPVGGSEAIAADVRVIAATHGDLKSAVAAGTFRADLFYRLNVFPIEVPPLRERLEDIPLLVEYFIGRYASQAGKKIRSIHKRTLEQFQSYVWPGNLRELQNVIERSVILCEGETLSVDPSWLTKDSGPARQASRPLTERLMDQEREIIESALAASKGRVAGPSGAAARVGMPPSTLEARIKVLTIDKKRFNSG
jgi:DNA-binding NtrC family response regulator